MCCTLLKNINLESFNCCHCTVEIEPTLRATHPSLCAIIIFFSQSMIILFHYAQRNESSAITGLWITRISEIHWKKSRDPWDSFGQQPCVCFWWSVGIDYDDYDAWTALRRIRELKAVSYCKLLSAASPINPLLNVMGWNKVCVAATAAYCASVALIGSLQVNLQLAVKLSFKKRRQKKEGGADKTA